jgi:hypothetical protein
LMIRHEKSDALQLEMATHYFASAFLGVLGWWLDTNMACSTEQLAQMVNKLTLPGLQEVAEG